MSTLLNFGLPKGSLEDATIDLFAKAGFRISKGPRSYRPACDDPELDGRFVRAQEMSRYDENGFFDCGLTGRDRVLENGFECVEGADWLSRQHSHTRHTRALGRARC